MTLEEMAILKRQIEDQILEILYQFRNKAKVDIVGIELNSVATVGDKLRTLTDVKLDIRLP